MANPLFLQQAPLIEGNAFSTVVNHTVGNAAFKTERRVLRDTALIPVYASAISFIVLVAYLITRIPPVQRLITRLRASSSDEPIRVSRGDPQFVPVPPPSFWDELKEHIASHGGIVIYLHNALRLAVCLALLGISVYAAIVSAGPQSPTPSLDMTAPDTGSDTEVQRKRKHGKPGKHLNHKKGEPWVGHQEWVEIAQCAFYHPVDAADGWVTWVKIGLLTIVGAVLPLIVPRRFVPVDPKNPLPPNREQTASILSLITWSFLDPVVLEASRVSHLPYESLPILADYDHAEHLMANGAPTLDPSLKPRKDRHLVWGLLWLYRWQYAAAVLLMTVKAVFSLVSPFVLNKLLHYLETGGEGAVYKPWLWIIGLCLAPVLGTIGFQLYLFITNRLLIRTEALITQLVFEHSLKIRMKLETGSESSTAASRAASVHEPEHPGEESGDTLMASGEKLSSPPKGKAPPVGPSEPSSPTPTKKDDDSQKDKNLVGRITNLISTDLENIVEARDFLFVIWYAPLQIALSIWFLYRILGGAAFVGLAVIPMREFKPSPTIEAQINEKRDRELKFIRKKQMFELLNNNVNHFLPILTMVATFATYTLVMEKQLSASIVFSSIAVFEVLRERMFMTFWEIPRMIAAKVSFDRINDFLLETELLDRYASSSNTISLGALPPAADSESIGFRNAVFSWSANAPSTPGGPLTPSRRNFRLRIEDDLFFEKGKLSLIIGPTGCGKTSMLMALLGEMHFQPQILESFYNLPRGGGVAYAAQEAWIQNTTVNATDLGAVLKQCALERDLTLFEAGDATEIGERGVTLR
ncbi:hypothetical protein FRC00_003144 [Tulasnella sp. 408]|nr:hypothetical protein FRC00_003144 [Tulasnella sp. 408]